MKSSERSQERLARSLQMLAEIEAGNKTPSRVETVVMARWDAHAEAACPVAHDARRARGDSDGRGHHDLRRARMAAQP